MKVRSAAGREPVTNPVRREDRGEMLSTLLPKADVVVVLEAAVPWIPRRTAPKRDAKVINGINFVSLTNGMQRPAVMDMDDVFADRSINFFHGLPASSASCAVILQALLPGLRITFIGVHQDLGNGTFDVLFFGSYFVGELDSSVILEVATQE